VKFFRQLIGCLRFRIKLKRALVCPVVNLEFQKGYDIVGS